MTKYDTIYVCPLCESEHTSEEWNEATEQDCGPNIMPIELAVPYDYIYTCPTCSHESGIQDLEEK